MRRKVEGSNPGPPPIFLRIRSEDIRSISQHAVQSVFFAIFFVKPPRGDLFKATLLKE